MPLELAGNLFFVLLGIIIIILLISQASKKSKMQEISKEARIRSDALDRGIDIFNTKKISYPITSYAELAFYIDEEKKLILVFQGETLIDELSFFDICGIEIKENGNTTNGIGRAIAGAIIAGGTGAVIGAITAETIINSCSIAVYTNNIKNPIHEYLIFENERRTLSSMEQEHIFTNELVATFKVIIETNKVTSVISGIKQYESSINTKEITTAIKDLSELKKQGAITEKEFEQKKKELLDRI
ncbi:SHOCT domain-containing protein [Butyrivibrio sp. AE3004]|uniref:SHOCT domain-containing protein n=1 Tax=Butyrivibrio sp. AE3004 TaxID=1506994 RepID=UPI000493C7A0|nr:SHOCT domain-containing protein [Butyrivibrio sp. AE3004]